MPFIAKYDRVDGGGLMMTGKIDGRTYTGHPLTTIGNTLASLSYIQYIIDLSKVSIVEYGAAGDDSFILVEEEDGDAIKLAIERCFAKTLEGKTHGLGQTCKTLDFSRGGLTFLSRLFVFLSDRCVGTRIPKRVYL